jgi:fructose/tagatose bisphosphate aldolase
MRTGVRQIAALVRSLREESACPLYLNSDHTHSLSDALEAAKAGFDAISFDASALPLEQNVHRTKEAVEALKAINPAVLVEGESMLQGATRKRLDIARIAAIKSATRAFPTLQADRGRMTRIFAKRSVLGSTSFTSTRN